MKRVLSVVLILLLLITLSACEYKMDGDTEYAPIGNIEFPTRSASEKGTVPYVVAGLIAKGQVVRDYIKLNTAANGAIEGYRIRTNGIDVEIYRFDTDAAFYKEIVSLGGYPVKDEAGKLVTTVRAVIREPFVMLVPINENASGQDITALNEKLIERFNSIKL